MENTTNNSFEEQWQKAFDDASLPPSEAVWERIELGLESNIPPKSGNTSYYIGVISAVILGISVWFFMRENEVKKEVQVIENKVINDKKNETIVSKVEEKVIVIPKEKVEIKKIFIPEKQEIIEPAIVVEESENQERIITDSVDFMSPIIITKKVNSELTNPTINVPFQQTPYYEIPKPKPQKKSIWEKVRVSGGVGVYQ